MSDKKIPPQDITFVILAGGFGTRLNSVLKGFPKVLADVNGKPFIFHLLDRVVALGGRRAVICTGYRADLVQKTIKKAYSKNLNLVFSKEEYPLGTGGALRLAHGTIKTEYTIVLNGDSFIKTDLEAFWNWCRGKDAEVGILLTHVDDTSRYGKVSLSEDSHIEKFLEKDSSGGDGLINAGVYFLRTELLLTIPDRITISLENDIFPLWLGRDFYGYVVPGNFIDIGIPESYQVVKTFF